MAESATSMHNKDIKKVYKQQRNQFCDRIVNAGSTKYLSEYHHSDEAADVQDDFNSSIIRSQEIVIEGSKPAMTYADLQHFDEFDSRFFVVKRRRWQDAAPIFYDTVKQH